MMAEVAAGELCLVTGGTGFVATHVIEALIAAGHKVRATVRSLSDQDKCQWLESRHVQPVAADLMSSKGWAESLENVTYVFHVASPFKLNVKDGRKELVEPAINGTRNLLEACLASKTLKRVVLTSSVAAIAPEGGKVAGSLPELGENGWTEHAWNYLANLKDSPYPLSKVEAERFAWSFVGMHKSSISWDLVSVNPSAIFGPILFPPKSVAEVNTSNTVIEKILNKAYPGYPAVEFPCVDVRDVARLHLLAAFTKSASGRYICHQGTLSMKETAQFLHTAFPGLKGQIPDATSGIPNFIALAASLFDPTVSFKAAWNLVGEPAPKFDNSKAIKELGMQYRDPSEQVVDTARSLATFPGILKDPKVVEALTVKIL